MRKNEEAIGAYLKAIEKNPNYADAYLNLSLIYFHKKDYALAIKYCDKAAELGCKVPAEYLNLLKSFRK